MEWHEVVVRILSGLVVIIPLVVKLVEYVQKAVKERNWNQLLALVMNLMAEAECRFDCGSDRKSWVLSMIEASAGTINYDIDMEQVSDLIDELCKLSKTVNAPQEVCE